MRNPGEGACRRAWTPGRARRHLPSPRARQAMPECAIGSRRKMPAEIRNNPGRCRHSGRCRRAHGRILRPRPQNGRPATRWPQGPGRRAGACALLRSFRGRATRGPGRLYAERARPIGATATRCGRRRDGRWNRTGRLLRALCQVRRVIPPSRSSGPPRSDGRCRPGRSARTPARRDRRAGFPHSRRRAPRQGSPSLGASLPGASP